MDDLAPGKRTLFFLSIDEDFVLHYPNTMDEITLRGWLDKAVDGVKESMRMRAMLAGKTRG